MATIVLDPGHGGSADFPCPQGKLPPCDSTHNNAVGPAGTLEKDLTLAIGLLTQSALIDLGHQVILTRTTDVNVRLADRAAVAENNQASVFVSIHFNGPGPSGPAQGTETWLNSDHSDVSKQLADRVQAALVKATALNNRGVKSKALGVLNPAYHLGQTAMCLTEISFLSGDAQEEARLNTPTYQASLASALATGINDYLTQPSVGGRSYEQPWFEVLAGFWDTHSMIHYFSPVGYSPAVSVSPFGPFNAGTAQAPDWRFRTSVAFAASSSAPLLFAMTDGCIYYQPGPTPDTGGLILKRGDCVGTSVSRDAGILPSWCPQPLYIVYDNVSKTATRSAAVTLLKTSNRADIALQYLEKVGQPTMSGGKTMSEEQLADLWLAGGLPSGIFTVAGETIGAFGAATSGSSVDVSMAASVDPLPDIYYNPAYFMLNWKNLGFLKDTQVFPELLSLDGPLCGNGIIRQVSGGGSSILGTTLSQANAGDTILITDSQTYAEALVIDKGVNILGASTQVIDPVDVADPQKAIPIVSDYPTLTGQVSFRPVTITSPKESITQLGKLIVNDGVVDTGGNVFIGKDSSSLLTNCFIESGVTTAPANIFDFDVISDGDGGGIYIDGASPAILSCVVRNNIAALRGGGIALFGCGLPVIYACRIENNVTGATDGDGGGVSLQVAVPNLPLLTWDQKNLDRAFVTYARIIGCTIQGNRAQDDGGGIYITNASRVIVRDCQIRNNSATNNGGGIRMTFGSHLMLSDSVVEDNVSNNGDSDNTTASGGGIAARNAGLLRITRTSIRNNTARKWAGGGLSFISISEGAAKEFGVTLYDFDDVLTNRYQHTGATLWVDADTVLSDNKALDTRTQLAPADQHAKGGGVYILRNSASAPLWDVDFRFMDSVQSILATNQASASWDPLDPSSSTTHRVYFLDTAMPTLSAGHADDNSLAARETSGLRVFINAF
jgi:parallel beta-helix repeat protein